MKLSELKELARQATPGPWSTLEEEHEVHAISFMDNGGDPLHIAQWINESENADFISAANPQTILELIERVERLSQCLDIIRDKDRINNLHVLHYAEIIAHKGLITYGPDVPLGDKK